MSDPQTTAALWASFLRKACISRPTSLREEMNWHRDQQLERVRAEKARLEPTTDEKPVRPYRSEAERVAVTQRNVQIGLSLVILAVAAAGLLADLGVIG